MLIEKKKNHLLLKACLMLSLVLFSSYLVVDLGILSLIIESDRSKISLIILSIYVLACAHWFYISINLGAFLSMLLTPYVLKNYSHFRRKNLEKVICLFILILFIFKRKSLV